MKNDLFNFVKLLVSIEIIELFLYNTKRFYFIKVGKQT